MYRSTRRNSKLVALILKRNVIYLEARACDSSLDDFTTHSLQERRTLAATCPLHTERYPRILFRAARRISECTRLATQRTASLDTTWISSSQTCALVREIIAAGVAWLRRHLPLFSPHGRRRRRYICLARGAHPTLPRHTTHSGDLAMFDATFTIVMS